MRTVLIFFWEFVHSNIGGNPVQHDWDGFAEKHMILHVGGGAVVGRDKYRNVGNYIKDKQLF